MKRSFIIICVTLLTAAHAASHTLRAMARAQQGATAAASASSPQLQEAGRLNAEVVKLFAAGKFEEALPLARRVLELREQALGGEHILVAYALNNLASIYFEQKRAGEAEPLFKRALVILDKTGAQTDLAADVNTQLGMLRMSKENFGEAEPFLRRALDIREKVHGADDPALVPALLNMTDVRLLRRDPQQANELLGRAVSILKSRPPAKDPALAQRLSSYLCQLMGRSAANDKELADKVSNAIWRAEEPEAAAKYEREQKEKAEREARGESSESSENMTIVEGGVINGHAVSKPPPDYPVEAKQKRVGGTVIVRIIVDESGRVMKAEALCGHPLLAKAATEAARAARFTPTKLSGRPVKVSGVITYNFVIQ